MKNTKGADVNSTLKLKSQLAVPVPQSPGTEAAQSEADRWAEERRLRKAAKRREWGIADRLETSERLKRELGWTSVGAMLKAWKDGVIKLPRRPKWYIAKRGRRWNR